MARKARTTVSMFNFSFVDILATTIGVIIFIMVMALIDASDKMENSEETIQERQDELAEQLQKAREEARRLKELAEKERKTAETYVSRQKDQAEKKKHARAKLGQARDKNAWLKGRLAEHRREVTALRERLEEEKRKQSDESSREVVEFRIPEVRQTDKKPVLLECDEGKVYVLAVEGRLKESNYTGRSVGMGRAIVVTRKADARGERPAQANRRGSQLRDALPNNTWRGLRYAHFLVRTNSYDAFRELRQDCWDRGYEVGWRAYRDDETFVFGTGGSGGSGGGRRSGPQ